MSEHFSRLFSGLAWSLGRRFPNLPANLKRAYISEDAVGYISASLLYCILLFAVGSVSLSALFVGVGGSSEGLGPLVAFCLASFLLFWRLNRPAQIVRKRLKNIEKNLPFAIQSIYIQVSSGVPIYDAMSSVSRGNFGEISSEFKVTLNEVQSGKPLTEALETLIDRNPSVYFQRVMWQIVNTLSTGGRLMENMADISRSISRDQLTAIRVYGGRLSPLSMAYMLVAVILPALGITLIITVSSLPNIGSKFDEGVLWVILALTLALQAQFLMIIQSSRPNLIGD
jgi:flagellar protein FlaJ